MKKTTSFLWLWLLLPVLAQATGDSLHYLTPKDSVFLYTGMTGEKMFDHKIEKKQTFFSLAKFYGLTTEELFFYNPDLRINPELSIGQIVHIPIPNRAILRYKTPEMPASELAPIFYTVQKGETLYRIAQVHFKMPVDTVIQRNKLADIQLKIGQSLFMGWISIHGIPDSLRQNSSSPVWNSSMELGKKFLAETPGKTEVQQQGTAHWPKESQTNNAGLYALHNEAPLQSTVAIHNPMTNRTVYVRVIGRIPKTYDSKVVVVVSPAVAQMLGAIDANFFVRMRFLK